ncbi:SRPBCC domain-containing protein [Knoellia sp. p5-6-4]|uniref:SRPBCC family protein n=1 Tax=unclassified Knoellia TaxID=2618719 RepID=UPI0023DB5537|nr:SRPBCC domain-containing protein [Knoellia sp. p5-6-4]MDF2145406.1 SRPBCC domain-containing protein [Knoellia sp. p5-6-4]
MSITSISKDTDQLTMTVTADYDVSADRAWQLWADPRQLERWWGPPTYPATVEQHDLREGGHVDYYMTGPEGDRHRGWWNVREVEAPRVLVVEDGFADESGAPNSDMPTMVMRVEITDRPGGVTVTISSRFPSLEAMEQLLQMGMEEGLTQAMGQIDAILAGEPARARS